MHQRPVDGQHEVARAASADGAAGVRGGKRLRGDRAVERVDLALQTDGPQETQSAHEV